MSGQGDNEFLGSIYQQVLLWYNKKRGSNFTSSDSSTAEELATFHELDTELEQLLQEIVLSDRVFEGYIEAILVVLFSLLTVAGFLLNSLCVVVISKSRRLRRAPQNILLLNLLVSDILISLVCCPLTLVTLIRKRWPFGPLMCKIIPYTQATSVTVSCLTVAAVALDRLVRITSSTQATAANATITTPGVNILLPRPRLGAWSVKQVTLETLGIWFTSAILCLPVLVFQNQRVVGPLQYVKCVETFPPGGRSFFALTSLIVLFLGPVTALITSHVVIKRHLERSIPGTGRATVVGRRSSPHTFSLDEDQRQRIVERNLNRNRKVTSLLLGLSMAFASCWLPLNALNVYLDFHEHEPPTSLSSSAIYALLSGSHLLAMTSAPVNAFLYGWLNSQIRSEARITLDRLFSGHRRASVN